MAGVSAWLIRPRHSNLKCAPIAVVFGLLSYGRIFLAAGVLLFGAALEAGFELWESA